MPTYNLASISVDFPFEAYDVQLVYMEKVVMALEAGSNALLESPTGTGKTLCLLCAALGWRRAQLKKQQPAAVPSQSGRRRRHPQRLRPAAPSRTSVCADGGADGGRRRAGRRPARRGGRARRPPAAHHLRLANALAAPAGGTRARRTAHRPLVCMLGSREQLCCHPEISKRPGPGQAAGCQALVAAQGCGYYRKLQEVKRKNGRVAHPEESKPEGSRRIGVIEDFVKEAKGQDLCPFHSRELQATSDVLFLPYNYLLDPKARRALNIDLRRDVIIFDEVCEREERHTGHRHLTHPLSRLSPTTLPLSPSTMNTGAQRR